MIKLNYFETISSEQNIRPEQVEAVLKLFDEGSTVPFIARYRKEATGELDEVAITAIRDRHEKLVELEKRREAIIASLQERELLTDELRGKIEKAGTMTTLEDIYLPFRPKRKTRASIAAEKGLSPLADEILAQTELQVSELAAKYLSENVPNVEEALKGASDIIAERVSEDMDTRSHVRRIFARSGVLRSARAKIKEDELEKSEAAEKYRDWFEWSEPVAKAPSHRVLALLRGEREGCLSIDVAPLDDEPIVIMKRNFIKGSGESSRLVGKAIEDGYKRLLKPSMETELRNALKKKADGEAIRVFAQNVKEVLMSPPMGAKRVIAIDPGLRTGCKLVCLGGGGELLHHEVIQPHQSTGARMAAANRMRELTDKFNPEAIAIGNGTAGRETEQFVKELKLPEMIHIVSVNESGASVYSASEAARREFPEEDVTVRGAVSIGRRLMDPLAELIKIDPKSIGVGQYQHDVDQKELKRSLDDVVAQCVNAVGVEVNTASPELLSYVSGLNSKVALSIIKTREELGGFKSRVQLKKVPHLGAKTFEQAAGFLRIRGGDDPLDASAVHPERYNLVGKMASDIKCSIADLINDEGLRSRIEISKFVTDDVGIPTLRDIMSELAKPGRDPRAVFEAAAFDESIKDITDLKVGVVLQGIVTNVTAFGAFVDLGVHQDGLVHVSKISDKYITEPGSVLHAGQQVKVAVIDIDIKRRRISLSMKSGDLNIQ
ncbi:MAG: RNA-binding transcriptional accessory protein [Synergistaceae bacterium]|nr:RNA-binding transcriptional accessory protein [Synergistaceae bacterium]